MEITLEVGSIKYRPRGAQNREEVTLEGVLEDSLARWMGEGMGRQRALGEQRWGRGGQRRGESCRGRQGPDR